MRPVLNPPAPDQAHKHWPDLVCTCSRIDSDSAYRGSNPCLPAIRLACGSLMAARHVFRHSAARAAPGSNPCLPAISNHNQFSGLAAGSVRQIVETQTRDARTPARGLPRRVGRAHLLADFVAEHVRYRGKVDAVGSVPSSPSDAGNHSRASLDPHLLPRSELPRPERVPRKIALVKAQKLRLRHVAKRCPVAFLDTRRCP